MWSLLFAVLWMTACVDPATAPEPPDPTAPPPTGVTPTTFHDCTGRAFEPAAEQSWRHDILTPVTTTAGAPNHAGRDLIVKTATDATLEAKLTYGTIAKDLEDEDVRVSIDDCSGWQTLGDFTTDGDGKIRVPITTPLEVGAHAVTFQVLGDRSTTTATLWVLPPGTHLVVADVDGTLTTGDSQLFAQILDGSYVPAAYPGAAELMAAHRERGAIVVYLTGRPDWLTAKTRTWLDGLGFATGSLRVADATGQIVPTQSGVGDFKKSVIGKLQTDGYVIDAAYGNAVTDIYAYVGGGVAVDDIWIIGSHAGEQGTNAVVDSWSTRAAEVSASARVVQPFGN